MRPKKYRKKSPERLLLQRTYRIFEREFGYELHEEKNALFSIQLLYLLYGGETGILPNTVRKLLEEYKADLKTLYKKLEEEFYSYNDENNKNYINTGLFREVYIPHFSKTFLDRLLVRIPEFKLLSLTDFSALFENILTIRDKQSSGAFYTGKNFIHRVIDPLFLENLETELESLREEEVSDYLKRLTEIKILDPATGSGNFLIESFLSLKRLEKRARERTEGKFTKTVSTAQLYGIEINKKSVILADSLLYFAEKMTGTPHEKSNIINTNALKINWNEVLPSEDCNYIIGNPPFLGARVMGKEKKSEVKTVFGEKWDNVGNLDYAACWFKKANDYMKSTEIRAAFFTTSSIVQGEAIYNLWRPLFKDGLHFDFAYENFRWDSISRAVNTTYCVILAFSKAEKTDKPRLYKEENYREVDYINAYLGDFGDIYIRKRKSPLSPKTPEIGVGNKPLDGGYYLFTEEEMIEFLDDEPEAEKFFRPFYGSTEFITNTPRYILFLRDITPEELENLPLTAKRVSLVKNFRRSSKSAVTNRLAETPTRFHVENVSSTPFLLIPRASSGIRDYIPIGFMKPECISSDANHIVKEAGLYHFGILTSSLHMEWLRTIGGRLGNGYRYSKDIVYNNYPWPEPDELERVAIVNSARTILEVRESFSDLNFKDLYERETMPEKLKKAHRKNDEAVLSAYHFESKSDHIKALFNLYDTQLRAL